MDTEVKVYLSEAEKALLVECWEYANGDAKGPDHELKMLVVALAHACEVAGLPIETVA